MSGKFTGREI